ncbi:MAG: tRNA (adenosine(37)-N6)-threonylcarbamoyltransferase complex ATPase subunit type 1 TsaE [Azospirillum brasilense]|nr:MAG: tRNA (adenosine(37)-N6)-threonylcarbamoyltransferase complex ATPase subunit type 1 TsaE [Azospirillum brasilense]
MSATSHELPDLAATAALAQRLAPRLRAGDTLLLMGDLGAGKTTFTQALVQALSAAPVDVTSPTFTLVQDYPVQLASGEACTLYHYDLYRIEDERALIELGMDDAAEALRVIEWPERMGSNFAPASWLALTLQIHPGGQRRATLRAGGALATRLEQEPLA